MLETLPGEVKDCLRLCEDASKSTNNMKEIVHKLQETNIDLVNNKLNADEYRRFAENAKE